METHRTAAFGRLARHILFSASVIALVAAASEANAQDVESVVVSGSRLVTNGAQAPTPVTVVSADQLQVAAPRNVVDGLLQLPAFKGSVSVQNQSTGTTSSNGADYLNLRGLGPSRTLVLLDGRRVVPASSAGSVDAAQMPEALIQRVDVVTGGASAAYGSDAVAGVVNFILDTKFEGVKADAQAGISQYGDYFNYRVSVTGGMSFLDDRLHVVGSILDYKSNGVSLAQSRPWTGTAHAVGSITNPSFDKTKPVSPTNSGLLVVPQPYTSVAALGGLITTTTSTVAGVNTTVSNGPLVGTAFDPNGQAIPFNYGTLKSAAQMSGGDGYNPNLLLTLQPSQRRSQIFTHATYDFSDNFSAYVQVMGSQNHIRYNSLPTFELSSTNFTILRDNAYIPQTIKDYLNSPAGQNITSFTVGRVSPDFDIPHMDAITNNGLVTIGFDGKVPSSSWTYHGYGQMGRAYGSYKTQNDPISDNLYRASDAVVNPANGQIVCRQSLSNPAPTPISNPVGCQPLNIFGVGNASAASLKYITGTAIQIVRVAEDVAELSASGELFDIQGGAVSLAIGGSYRREAFTQVTDAQSQEIRTGAGIGKAFPAGLVNTLGGFERTNPQPTRGTFNVKEAFIETEVPLLKDMSMARALTFNAAGRYVDYSTSGGVEPWKLGLVYEPTDGLRIRASRSTDIRAANLGELYQGSSQGTSTVQDPANGNTTTNVITGAVGNPGLVPESANTSTIGVVVTPDSLLGGALPGLEFSIDYYQINISKAISTLTAQQELNFCANGSLQQCAFITRNPNGTLSRVALPFFNAAARQTKGVDFEASYSVPLSDVAFGQDGNLTFRTLVNYIGQFTTQVQGASPVQLAGDIGNSTPKWTGNFGANLSVGPVSWFVQERWISGGKYDNTNNNGQGIYPNNIGSVFYTDTTITYDVFDTGASVFFSIQNLFDRDPPPTPSFLIAGSNYSNRTLYDMIGRQFTLGVRYKM
jgi:outer membrane receptor protein involved in Fe transport